MKTKYTVVNEAEIDKLIEQVQKLLDQGWKLQGGMAATISESPEFYYPEYSQALFVETET